MPNISELSHLEQTANDYQSKTEAINELKHLKALATLKGNAVSAYRAAQNYPQNSSQYMKWMKIALDQGLTNAMLDMAVALAATGSEAKLQQAASYIGQILDSNDSFIRTQAKEFLSSNPLLFAEVSRLSAEASCQITNNSVSLSTIGFFAREPLPAAAKLSFDDSLQLNP
ncbi:hypothetical protein [Legionella brunensis]|uniref:Dot/Icm secretion system substrate n=1 Tax=Legionella brunensis TaxID=29422 RepID=A0A0W0S099_9GAMM|nr:hypothetical protein [Legionella brunensis]KTC76758.1 Dot/Icm secretion system substrate [Legionella brunensis]